MNPPMMSVEWRRVEASDLGALHRLHDQLFPVKYNASFYEKLVSQDGKTQFSLVAVQHDGQEKSIVAFVTTRLVPNEDTLTGWLFGEGAPVAYINTLGVAPSHQRRGLALEAIRRIETTLRAHRVSKFSLHVKSDNTPALALYRRLGFNVVRFHPKFYEIEGKLEDAFEMSLAITPESNSQRYRFLALSFVSVLIFMLLFIVYSRR